MFRRWARWCMPWVATWASHAAGELAGGAVPQVAGGHLLQRPPAASAANAFAASSSRARRIRRAALAVGFQARAGVDPGQRIGPRPHRADDVRERIVERAGADVEPLVELLRTKLSAGTQEVRSPNGRGSRRMGREVAFGHREDRTLKLIAETRRSRRIQFVGAVWLEFCSRRLKARTTR